ncbi:MAG: CRISPR-associated endoribonuclease Cas6, partial [Clostridia bacterium]|nr:CRISPR-associated endoribonuclease Cas6 [Clostridia bacterium]
MVFVPPLKLVICSPVPYLLQELGTGLLCRGELRLDGARRGVQTVAVTDPVVTASPVRVPM